VTKNSSFLKGQGGGGIPWKLGFFSFFSILLPFFGKVEKGLHIFEEIDKIGQKLTIFWRE
jgi:hypothetical protein